MCMQTKVLMMIHHTNHNLPRKGFKKCFIIRPHTSYLHAYELSIKYPTNGNVLSIYSQMAANLLGRVGVEHYFLCG
jgi:hypothetical protein